MHFDNVALYENLEHGRLVDVAHPHPIKDEVLQRTFAYMGHLDERNERYAAAC